ncbi:ABC transporter substrate-binding protein [Marinimicrococcus flavescens]|uniref:Extracellular solute-binding protein n=1 Tax=Marinimicrococcus flavescens TaxID=3031815 RepID=A0AAP4D5T8_9PROT|nr:extracellular solute-binding protein [Marinimicrococcus flavescens]
MASNRDSNGGKTGAAQGSGGLTRRRLLQTSAATAGAAVGSGLVTGFPTVWSQKLKDVTLLHVGSSYSAIIDIARQASQDLGFKIEMQSVNGDALVNRVVTQPSTVDIADLEYWAVRKVWPRGVLQGIETAKIGRWDKISPLFTQGKYPDGREVTLEGTAPYEVQYTEEKEGNRFAAGPTDHATLLPQIYNADTLGIRPDLIGRPIESWSELLNPDFAGKVALVDIPSIGIMDVAMALEAKGEMTYADKGNMTKEEIDKTIAALIDLKRQGHFRAFWNSFDQSVNLMASGEVMIQSMWSPAVTAVRTRGIDCQYVALKEGYRAWAAGLGLMRHLDGLKLEAAYEYMNWYLSGWQGAFIARQGYYTPVLETTKAAMAPDEWGYWYMGEKAEEPVKDPYGNVMEKAGAVRDGGSYEQRMGNIACWNTVMDENVYMVRKWNEFISA